MIKINFIHHTARTVIKGNGILYMRISGLDKELNISTNINVPKNDWDSKKEVIKSRNEQAYQFNKHISEIKNKVYSFIETKTKNNELISAELLKNHLKGKRDHQNTLLSLFDYYLVYHSSSHAKNTTKQYKSTKVKLLEYIKSKLFLTEIPLDRLNYRFISDFKVFLELEYSNHANTIFKDIQRLKAIIHFAQKLEWIKEDPFVNFKTKSVNTKKTILSFDEIERIASMNFDNETHKIVRDGFLLMCYTGLSYSDLASLKTIDIQISITGKKVIKINRRKTDEFCIIPVIDKANEIINEYQNNPTQIYAKITETKLMNDFANFETSLKQKTLLHKAI